MTSLNFADLVKLGAQADHVPEMKYGAGLARLQPNTAYNVKITAAAVTRSKTNNYAQLQLSLAAEAADGSFKPIGNKWVMLPVLDDEQKAKLGTEGVNKLIDRTHKQLAQILRIADPANFEVYHTVDKTTRDWKFLDHAGNEMSKTAREARAETISQAVIGVAMAFAQGQIPVDLVGTQLVMVEVPSNRPDSSGFTNFYGQKPDNIPAGTL